MAPYVSELCVGRGGRPGKGRDVEKLLHRDIGHLSDINAVFIDTSEVSKQDCLLHFFTLLGGSVPYNAIEKKNAVWTLTGGILSTRSCDGVFLRSFLFCGTHGRLLWDGFIELVKGARPL